jgi:hypothetical protein
LLQGIILAAHCDVVRHQMSLYGTQLVQFVDGQINVWMIASVQDRFKCRGRLVFAAQLLLLFSSDFASLAQ